MHLCFHWKKTIFGSLQSQADLIMADKTSQVTQLGLMLLLLAPKQLSWVFILSLLSTISLTASRDIHCNLSFSAFSQPLVSFLKPHHLRRAMGFANEIKVWEEGVRH
jgi:hypothetical protein